MSWISSKVSPVILFVIVSLAAVFFIAAILHLLIRFLVKQRSIRLLPHSSTEIPASSSSGGAFQRQLQQLFHLHDAGLDQAHIDALPLFSYRDVVGSKEPFDCAVCLCEFSDDDNLRLLPLCSHAFHVGCIDTWLLSNSTCPLCRGAILLSPGVSFENPVFYFGDDSKEEASAAEDGLGLGGASSAAGVFRPGQGDNGGAAMIEKRVFSLRLGKFKNVVADCRGAAQQLAGEGGETSNGNLDGRRCYSMGSFQYVVAGLEPQVALDGGGGGGGVGRRVDGMGGGLLRNLTINEEGEDGVANGDVMIGKRINGGAKGESFSVSKIWLWSKKGTARYSNAV